MTKPTHRPKGRPYADTVRTVLYLPRDLREQFADNKSIVQAIERGQKEQMKMTNKFAYIQTNNPYKLVRVVLHEENDYDSLNQVEIVNADEVPTHAFNLTNTLNRKWMNYVRQEAHNVGLKLRAPQTIAVR